MTITLSEAESRRIVARHGVSVSPFVTGSSADAVVEAVNADPNVTYPLVAKLCGRRIAHKTERGLVRLRIADEEALRSASNDLLAATRPEDGEVELLVSSMLPGNRELIAGLTTDPQFGLVAMFGVGGILAEAVRDVSFRLAPLQPIDAAEMIDDLETKQLFGEFRGEPAVDRDALISTLIGLCQAGADLEGFVSADLNPLIIVDGKPVAVDSLVEVESGDEPDERPSR